MKRKFILSSIILIMTLVVSNASFAAVEIIPSKSGTGKDQIVNTTVSNSYLLCQGMKDTGGSLKGTTVKPHLATNKDWGAVSYLSNSIYGTNTQGGNKGITVTINGVNYYSTTTNITGVMNWGSNPNVERYTQTAGLLNNYTSGNDNVIELYNNRETKYIDCINPSNSANTIGMAIHETKEKYSYINGFNIGTSTTYPCSIRRDLFAISFGAKSFVGYAQLEYTKGESAGVVTFRPVVWN